MGPNEIRKADKTTLRNFGLVMAIPFSLIAALLFWKESGNAPYLLVVAGLFALLGLAAPRILKPVYVVWMTFAYYMGIVMTYVILTVFFFVAVTPGGLIMRLFGKDPLTRKFPGNESTYWIPSEEYPDEIERYTKPY